MAIAAALVSVARDHERRRIERDLHNGAQQRLVALRIDLSIVEDMLLDDPLGAAARIRELEASAEAALEELRALAQGLHPPLLTDRGHTTAHPDTSDAPSRTIRVVIADDSYLARQALEHVLAAADGIEIVASCQNRDGLMLTVEAERPDVVVTDIRMPPTDTDEGIAVAARLRETAPEVGVVILSQFTDPRYGLALLESGSDRRAYLLKERIQHRGQLVAAIESVAAGGSVIDAKVVEALVRARHQAESSPLNELTARELEILTFVARGHSNQAIADELVLTKRAVEKHIAAIFLKLRLTDAADVARRVKATLIYLAEQPS
ncbi:MAG: response regulator [Baekduia sp.]